jgi:hypothetical protein
MNWNAVLAGFFLDLPQFLTGGLICGGVIGNAFRKRIADRIDDVDNDQGGFMPQGDGLSIAKRR